MVENLSQFALGRAAHDDKDWDGYDHGRDNPNELDAELDAITLKEGDPKGLQKTVASGYEELDDADKNYNFNLLQAKILMTLKLTQKKLAALSRLIAMQCSMYNEVYMEEQKKKRMRHD